MKYKNIDHCCSAMCISDALFCFENEEKIRLDWTLFTKFLKILSVLLIIFTIIFFTCFGCFLVLNDSTSWAAQTVTLSSEGAANGTQPDSMGEYGLAEMVIKGFLADYNWYYHKEREDRFLMYSNLGMNSMYECMILFHISPSDYRWYITHTNDTENVEGVIRSVSSGPIIYPELEWYPMIDIRQCTTTTDR